MITMGVIGIYGKQDKHEPADVDLIVQPDVKKKGYGTPEATAGNNTKDSGVGWVCGPS